MSVQVYSVPEVKSMDLSYKLFLRGRRGGANVTIIKVFTILIVLVGKGSILALFKTNQ